MKNFLLALSVLALSVNLQAAATRPAGGSPEPLALSPTLSPSSPSFRGLKGRHLAEAKAEGVTRLYNATRIINRLHGEGRGKDISLESLIATLAQQSSILESSRDPKAVATLAYACIPKELLNSDSKTIMTEAFEEYASGYKKRLPDANAFLDAVISALDTIVADSSIDLKTNAFIDACALHEISIDQESFNKSILAALKDFRKKDPKTSTLAAINCIPYELKDGETIKQMRAAFAPYEEGKKTIPSSRKLLNLVLSTLNEIITAIAPR